jgi:uncharacterized protein YdhG (YjbR/CyaY superfamily)
MTKSSVKYQTIDQYHATQPPEIQVLLAQLRMVIQQAAPMASETISYGMPAFWQDKVLVYYAGNKGHIGFYPTPGPIVYFKKELEQYNTSKGAIQFPLDKPLPLSLIKKIVEFRIEEVTKTLNIKVLPGILHEVPIDMENALMANPVLPALWNNLTPIQRNEWICWVTMVTKTETRIAHIQRMTEELKSGKRKPCCWPGCPHRRPSAKKWLKI